ncbi:MAG: HPF/RaiA family ribosome-associated protein [Fimbriimonadaceae bacterium]|jgi:putative sigma-54 modulation protein|nr:HPF/RaiA family ribosome-associated protein [Fimbriimonadaceae bacterium]
MKILLRNASGVLTQDDRDLAEKKFNRLNRYFATQPILELVHFELRGWHRLEVTLRADGRVIRAVGDASDFRQTVDQAVDNCEFRLAKLKDRVSRDKRGSSSRRFPDLESGLSE